MFAKINKLTDLQASITIALIGLIVYADSLFNSFYGDDQAQIVNNPVIHSIAHLKLFFLGGTFYTGNGIAPLSGIYFRPLMTTVFSVIYTLFGPHPFYFHLFQLLICLGSAIVLYLFFKLLFSNLTALLLALIFLVHPLNSQVVFSIAAMQDALFLFFGMLGLYVLVSFKSKLSLLLVAGCLFLSLLAKETGIVFVFLCLLYLVWWSRKRLLNFITFMSAPFIVWLALRIHAIGLNPASNDAPIDKLHLGSRLLTSPSIFQFYVAKLLFPWKLASAYFWYYPHFSVRYTLLPLLIDLVVIALVVYAAITIKKKAPRAEFYRFMFFAVWAALGLFTTLQVVALDMTACETWFYVAMPGVLGMIGVLLTVHRERIRQIRWLPIIGLLLIILLGTRTVVRGLDWRNQYTLAAKDVKASAQDYTADNILAASYAAKGDYASAIYYGKRSVATYPTLANNQNLGLAYYDNGQYAQAYLSYKAALTHGNSASIDENLGTLMLIYGNDKDSIRFLQQATSQYPTNPAIWEYLAIIYDRNGFSAQAKHAITQAALNGQVPRTVYNSIMTGTPTTIHILNTDKTISLP